MVRNVPVWVHPLLYQQWPSHCGPFDRVLHHWKVKIPLIYRWHGIKSWNPQSYIITHPWTGSASQRKLKGSMKGKGGDNGSEVRWRPEYIPFCSARRRIFDDVFSIDVWDNHSLHNNGGLLRKKSKLCIGVYSSIAYSTRLNYRSTKVWSVESRVYESKSIFCVVFYKNGPKRL